MSLIGIIGAMQIEIEGLLADMQDVDVTTAAGLSFHQGKLADKDVVVACCGIGKVNAAMCAQAMVDRFPLLCLINLGVAGAISNELNIKDVVISKHLVQHDFDITSAGHEPGFVPNLGIEIPADQNLAKAAFAACQEVLAQGNNKAHIAPIATGDQFVAHKDIKRRVSDVFNAYCVEMEGAAIAQVCHHNGLPFVVIRAISDKADGSAEMDFADFVAAAADNSIKIVKRMVISDDSI